MMDAFFFVCYLSVKLLPNYRHLAVKKVIDYITLTDYQRVRRLMISTSAMVIRATMK